MENKSDITVLYINDDTELLVLLRRQLTNESDRLDVMTADSASEGEQLLTENEIDCILCDHHMPGQTGLEFLKAVRKEYPDLPFLLFTETGNEAVASASIEAGVTDYVIQDAIANQASLLVQKIVTHVEHRRTQRETERTNRRLREIASVTDQVWWVFSPDWDELRYITDGYETIFGQSVDELRAAPTSFLEQIHEDDIDRVKLVMESVSEGTPQDIEYRVTKSDAVQLWVESRCKPIADETGTVISIVGLTQNITDRKLYQQELSQTINQLEEFTATVSHDLRNPLNVAMGNLDLAAEDCESQFLDAARDAVTRMDTLIDDLLALAKEGKLVGERQEVAFEEMLTQSYENVHAPQSTLEITDSTTLECDPARVMEAFENIIRNAVEHAGEGVTLTAGVLGADRGVYIADDGPGIPASKRDDIFERGYTTRTDGTGFGLAIVERIITGHDWEITVTEGDAGGARFEIVF